MPDPGSRGSCSASQASRSAEVTPATALGDLPSDHSYLDIPAFLRRQAD